MIVFDIETGPARGSDLRAFFPDFDPKSVKLGNTKDPAKIAEKIESAREKHTESWGEFVAKAALSAHTGSVVAIGFRVVERADSAASIVVAAPRPDGFAPPGVSVQDEAEMLVTFWDSFSECARTKGQLVGWNSFGFDLPFLVQRSWRHKIKVPSRLLEKNRYWHESLVDLMQVWACGKYGTFFSLDNAARFFGVGAKNGDGALFADQYFGEQTECAAAVAYLENDLQMTAGVALAMGLQ